MREKRNCLICGAEFSPRPYQIRTGAGKYCSLKCSSRGTVKQRQTPEALAKRSASMRKSMKPKVGAEHPRYKGRYVANGYVWRNTGRNERNLEHRVVIEEMIGRPLRSDEIVHHKNHDRTDNRPENLVVMTRAEHLIEHFGELLAGRK
jgi:hypothetical protein